MATVELIQGDCLDVMRGMGDKSVDAVIIENHLKNIDPHYQTITVNGEDVPVHFQTRGNDG